ncbi:hypothetical protein [Microvirga yunnanensis]|uniref:hypothetical protein n=1 Tax=Microvirga yunnanensis TaxID=2953740 RepID=UPI0021C781BB|nr:hypothetical protein [Microvirga sp. HBU65207]
MLRLGHLPLGIACPALKAVLAVRYDPRGSRKISLETGASKPWDPGQFAWAGALLGLAAGFAHQTYDIYTGQLDGGVYPFVYFLTKPAVFGSGGAAVLAIAAAVRNGARRRQSRGPEGN